ncbi:MAG: autotransporter domain-containing protein [Robiginitomaculum sp.]
MTHAADTFFTSHSSLGRLLLGSALPALALALSPLASAQTPVEIDSATTQSVRTSTAGDNDAPSDVTITTDGSITLTTAGPAVIVDSDNDFIHSGAITISDVDNATGIEVQTGNTGSITISGSITIDEDYSATDTDDDKIVDGPFAEGTGRTGILISGADTFTGPVNVTTANTINIEGNDSAGMRLVAGAGVLGDMSLLGSTTVTGDNAIGIDLAGNVTGNVTIGGRILTRGVGAQGVSVSGDVSDRLSFTGNIGNTGYRRVNGGTIPSRERLEVRELYDGEDTLESGSAVNVSGNVAGGIIFAHTQTDTTNEDTGAVTSAITSRPNITNVGRSAAVLIAGNGMPIVVGLVADITDPADDDYDAEAQYGLINQGTIRGEGVLDDVAATGLRIENATIAGGFNNVHQLSAQTYRTPIPADGTNVTGDVAHATALSLGSGATVPTIANIGTINAIASEAPDVVFADSDNPLDPNSVNATAISIEAGANVTTIFNRGTISSLVTGRLGQAYAIVDQSGTLAVINNQGIIQAGGLTNDTSENPTDPVFTLVAIDVSANTSGVTITQSQRPDLDPDDAVSYAAPQMIGDVLLGSGADTLDMQAGTLVGDVSFGDGADTLSLSGNSTLTGSLTDSDGLLTIAVTDGSTLVLTEATTLNVTDASFDATSTFSPIIDAAAGQTSTLIASGTISFADGATLTPTLANVIGNGGTFTIAQAGTLSIADISALQSANSPYLYETVISQNNNDLIATMTLRTAAQLGLDVPQAAAFNAAFGAISADADLGSAFAGLIDQTSFNAAYNQLLPEFAAAIHHFVHANVDGATGAVATHLNTARRGQDGTGGAWIEEFAYFADRELAGLSEAYRGNGFGFTGGFDSEFGPFHTAGVNLSYASTAVEDVVGQDDPLSVQTLQAGLYAGYEAGKFGVDLYVGGGYNSFESNRKVNIGDFAGEAAGDWSGAHYNASASAGYDINMGKRFYARPSVNVSYLNLTEKAYTETGSDAIRFGVGERVSEIGTATAMMTFGGKFEGDRIWYSPGVRVGYRNDFIGGGIVTNADFIGSGGALALTSQEFPDTGLILGVTFAAGSKYSSFGFDYDADLRDGYNRHIARLVLRLLF